MKDSYLIEVVYGETELKHDDLAHWDKARAKKIAKEVRERALVGAERFSMGEILAPELQDCVDRAAERFSPEVSLPLELFWTASRGVYTYYSALQLGARNGKGYLEFDSIGSIGEGIALFVLEDRSVARHRFALELMYRPLNDSPDMLMYYADEPARLALVEAKATLRPSVTGQLDEAISSLVEILKGWEHHRSLASTDALAVATSLRTEGLFSTTVVKLTWGEASHAV